MLRPSPERIISIIATRQEQLTSYKHLPNVDIEVLTTGRTKSENSKNDPLSGYSFCILHSVIKKGTLTGILNALTVCVNVTGSCELVHDLIHHVQLVTGRQASNEIQASLKGTGHVW